MFDVFVSRHVIPLRGAAFAAVATVDIATTVQQLTELNRQLARPSLANGVVFTPRNVPNGGIAANGTADGAHGTVKSCGPPLRSFGPSQ